MKRLTWRKWRAIVPVFLCIALVSGNCFAKSDIEKLDTRIREARLVIGEMHEMPDTSIPKDLLKQCSGVAIFPSTIKGGFVFGGQYGQGVLLNRDKKTGKWSAPVFISIGGASFGFQIGGQATDMILVIMNERGMDSLSHGNVALGGDVSAAAGPIGRDAALETDALLKASIFTYSRSKGLFAGVSLKGSIVGPMKNLNEEYYGEGVTASDILFSDKIQPTAEGEKLIEVLEQY